VDYSEYGWSVVAEYDAKKLAKNSDDERKIEKAVKRNLLCSVRSMEATESLSPACSGWIRRKLFWTQ